MKLISIFLLFSFAIAAGNESANNLIEKLVLLKSDVTVEDGTTFIKTEASVRINSAGSSLSHLGRDAWPVLLQHLDDERESVPAREVSGPYDVGHQCYCILSGQVVNLPKGYIKAKTREGKDGKGRMTPGLYYSFSPDLKNWLHERREWTLTRMQLEVITNVLKENDEIGYANNEDRDRIRGLLLEHIKLLESKQAKEIAEKSGAGQPATRPESKLEGNDKPQPESEGRSR